MEKKLSFSEVLKKYTMVIVLVLVVIMFTANTKGVMLLPQNVNNLVAQNAYVFILATGMLFCILTGGNIDLSVGSVVCFVAAVGGKMMVLNNMNPYLTMLVMLITGIAIGAWQGFWIAYVRIPPFIVTLAGMLAFRGLSNVVLQGQTLAPMPDSYLYCLCVNGTEKPCRPCEKRLQCRSFRRRSDQDGSDLCSCSCIYVPSGAV